MTNDSLRRGWCPGALRPMESGDGLIVRLRAPPGPLLPARLHAIADAARAWGNGLIDLTQRANLQIRGVSTQTLPDLQAALADWGWLDSDPAQEAIRNIQLSPLAGLDPGAAIDGVALARRLSEGLRSDQELTKLPGKFGFVIDDGSAIAPDPAAADIGLQGLAPAAAPCSRTAGGGTVLLRLAGLPVGLVSADGSVAAALSAARLFLRRRRPEHERRMRDLLPQIEIETLRRELGLAAVPALAPAQAGEPVGWHPDVPAVGIGIPFGRVSADVLDRLAELAAAAEAQIGLSAARAVLLAGAKVGPDLLRRAELLGLIADAAAPGRRILACPGAPFCPRALAPTQSDGAALAKIGPAQPLPPPGQVLHLSACAKGCAHPHWADITLTAVEPSSGGVSTYDLIRKGRAEDPPHLTGLTVDQLADCLRREFAV